MPKYITGNGGYYNVPDNKVNSFLKKHPDAKIMPLARPDDNVSPAPARAKAQPRPTEQATSPASAPQPSQPAATQGYSMSEADRLRYMQTLGQAQGTLADSEQLTRRMENMSRYNEKTNFGLTPQASPLGRNDRVVKEQRFNPATGNIEDSYLTSRGSEHNTRLDAEAEQADIDRDTSIEGQIREAYAEKKRIEQALQDRKRERGQFMGYGPATAGLTGPALEDSEYSNLMAAYNLNEKRIASLEAERDDDSRGFLSDAVQAVIDPANSQFWRSVGNTLSDADSWSFGMSEMNRSGAMTRLKNKLDQAHALGIEPKLNSSEQALVNSYFANEEAQQYDQNRGAMWNFGNMFGQSVPFMAEFMMTGGGAGLSKGITRAGTSASLRAAESAFGRYMTKNLGTIPTKVMQSTIKGTGRLAGAAVGGAFQSNTIGAARTYSDIVDRHLGKLTVDNAGKLTFDDGEDWGKAILKGQLTNIAENGSELLGPAFDFIPGYLGRVIKKKVGEGMINRFLGNKWMRGGDKVLRMAGIDGVFGEGMEEEANGLFNAIIGESNWFKDPSDPNKPAFFDAEEQLNTWLGVAITGGVLRAPQTVMSGYHTAQHYGYKYNLHFSNRNARELFGADRWSTYRDMMDNASNKDLGRTLNQIVNDPSLSTDEKMAVFTYANDLARLRGFNLGTLSAEASGVQPIRPRTANYNVRGNVIEEVDDKGNVIETHEYEDRDSMKAGLYGMMAERANNDMLADVEAMKTLPDNAYGQMLNEYCAANGISIEDFEAIMNKPFLERSDGEQALTDAFAKQMHDRLYAGNDMLHTEESMREGQDIADEMSIDLDNVDPVKGHDVLNEWKTAQQARNELFDRNEELKQEVELMERQGLSPQEILSRLDTFRPDDVNTMIGYYNSRARYAGFMSRTEEKIDEEAKNSRERHAFKGTINGNADLSNVYTITDGTNEYYLVSGNITTDPSTGRISGTTSGLIIGMDLDGSFVQLNEDDGYSVLPVTESLDQFEEAERLRLQEQVSAAVDPEGAQAEQEAAAVPQPTEQQAGNVGVEAGANTGTGADETPTAAPANPVQPENPPSPSGEAAGTPAVSIESVTDKDGIKRYENGVGVDDAIADIQNDGFDVGEVADASIAEAQQTIDKINGKATKTRKDLLDRKKAQGVIDYYQALKERAAMLLQGTEETPANGEENVNNQPEQPVSGENVVPSQPGQTVEELKQERIKALKAELGELFDDDFTKANDVFELVSMWIGRKRNLAWDDVNGKRGLQKELGWTRKIGGDTKYIETLLAKKGEGVGVDEFVHMVWESEENTVNGEKRFDTDEIKNALLDLLKSAESKSDVVDYAVNTREQAARAALEAQQQMEQEAEESGEIIPPTDEELAQTEANLPFAAPVEGEDIPENPLTALWEIIREVSQDGGMPAIRMVDTDQMTDSDWEGFASDVYGGAFISEEEVDAVRNNAMEMGIAYNPNTGVLDVFSGAVTPESLREKLEQIKEEYNEAINRQEEDGGSSESSGDSDLAGVRNEVQDGEGSETPAAAGAAGTESQGSPESAVDEYLQPRNEKEEKIVADVMAQLQQEIDAAIKARDKAANDLQKAQAKESDRATDMFSDDEAFQEPDQLFSFDEMGGTDRTQEGVNRRTAAERKALQDAQKKLDQLQSEAERNSRIRGALDNERRQTSFTPAADATGTVTGRPQSREEYLASHPLTEEQIMADTEANEDEKLNAIDFLRGEDDSAISRFYYDSIYERAQKKATDQIKEIAQRGKKPANPQQTIKWQYQFHYDKETGRAWITRDDWSGGVPIGDGRFRIEGKSLSELRAILENPNYNLGSVYEQVEAQLHNAEVGEQLRNESNPINAIETAAKSFREEQKAKDQQDIDKALDEFNKFLDDAKGSNVLDAFMRKGLEGNDKAQANLLDAFTLTNDAQRMFLKDLLRLASKVGYAYIKSGVHDVQAWSKKMSDTIGRKLNEVLGWDDAIIGEFVGEVWQQKYIVDGVRMRLSEHAERLKKGAKNTEEHPYTSFREFVNDSGINVTDDVVKGKLQKFAEAKRAKFGFEKSDSPLGYTSEVSNISIGLFPGEETLLKQWRNGTVTWVDKENECVFSITYKPAQYMGRKDNLIIKKEYLTKEKPNNAKDADTTVNVNKTEDNELENVVSSQQKPASELEGDSAEFAARQYKIEQLSKKIRAKLQGIMNWGDQPKPLSAYKQIAKELGIENFSDTDLQELIETEVVNLAREIANKEGLTEEKKFQKIVKLYEGQPSLNARDNDRINKQQYSTPAPMAFLMGQFLKPAIESQGKERNEARGLEPSAGNGMLTINLPKEKMHVNDIDEMRLSNLQKQGFGEVTSQDGLQSFGDRKFDVVVTNPPFGNVTPKVYDGIYEISGLEHQMAINSLESMKDDGRAAIIIGGNTEYNQNGSIKGKDRAFLNYLYAHYNVVDVINMNGHELYSRQGTGFPVRMILINGRKEFNPRSFAPTIQKARAERVNSYDELYKRVNDDILRNKEHNGDSSNGVHTAESGQNGGLSDNGHVSSSNETGVRNVRTGRGSGEHQLPTESVVGVQRSNASAEAEGRGRNTQSETNGGLGARTVLLHGRGDQSEQSGGSETVPSRDRGREVADGGSNTQRLPGKPVDSRRGLSVEQQEHKRELGEEKVPYRKQSGNPFDLQSKMPAEQAEVVKKSLEELGDVDQFLVDELGYSSKEELYSALAAEQIDSVALAIHQMKKGDAFIIGDQTGVGKGRQGAALIRWAVKQGNFPVYFTKTPDLFSGVYRDLKDIHSSGLRPFILASDAKGRITERQDGEDVVIYDLPSKKEVERVLDYINKNGKLPPEYDYVVTTYSQVSGGTMDYENGQKKARSFKKGKSARPADINGQKKRDAIENLASSSIVLMDESHEAGGESARGSYLQYISTKAKGITYISATFAKRPDNMPLYSLRTAISKAGVKVGELIDAVKRGGATFQEIMSKALTEAGQMIRRERDMRGVTVDWKGIEDEDVIKKHYEQYDQVIGLFNDIIYFQRTYVDPIVNKMNDDAAEEQGEVEHTPGTRDMGINNTPFASRTYNMVQQVLLALKAEEGAKFAVECLKNGEKPVIAVQNTNEGAADEAVGSSDEDIEMPDLSVNLKKGLRGTLRISQKDAFGNSTNTEIPFDRLSEAGQKRYQEIMDAIESASTGLSLSPIDVIRDVIKKAGYSVEELTGRSKVFDYNEDGTVKRTRRDPKLNKKRASDFNDGKVDALIVNKSACTGIDLHAGMKFKNTDQRHMITIQAQGDINDEVQMRGRTDRTGQKQHSKYTYIVSTIPSEQRLLMMLKAKLRSLDANTTSSQKSKFNEMQVQDIINKYGDEIVIQYLSEHPDMATKMVDPLKWTQKFGDGWESMAPETLASGIGIERGEAGSIASKVLGRMALLKVAEQEKMLQEIGDLYQAEIDRLNEMGENDLEITEMPLRAKTLKKDVWEEGVEPGGKNPFADNSYVEEVEMDVLKKPMKAEEVKKSQARLLGSAPKAQPTGQPTWEDYKRGVLEKVDAWAEQKKSETTQTITERAEKKATAEKEKYAKAAKKAQEKNGMTDSEIEKNAQYQYDNFYNKEMEKLKNALDAIDKQKQAFVDALETFSTDGVYALPTDIYDVNQITFEPSFGKVIDIKIADNFSTTASTISFATLDGRRKITIPISGMVKQQNNEKVNIVPSIVSQTAQARSGFFGSNVANTLKVLEQNVDNWDRLTSTATRKKGYIITGNLLKALTSLQKQHAGGKLISYTTDTGEIRQGVLMGDRFDPGLLTSQNPISSAKADLDDWEKNRTIKSSDGDVTIKAEGYDSWMSYTLKVPKSKKKGEKYFNDKTLLSLMDGQFEGSSAMKADFKKENLDKVLKRLDELGVTVESKKDDTVATEDPMQAIEQAASHWRRSAKESESSLSGSSDVSESGKKAVPLERRTMKSNKDKNGNYHEGIEEELARLESEISAAINEGSDEEVLVSEQEAGVRGRAGAAGQTEAGGAYRPNSGRRINELRRQAASLRAEIARRDQKKQELRKKYNIDEKGNISLDDLARMFRDLNGNKAVGRLFEKVAAVLKKLNVSFRFTDNLDAMTAGEAGAFYNATFYNWDVLVRDGEDQTKAGDLLHEMIHNVAEHILMRYDHPELQEKFGKLSAELEKAAREIKDIFKAVRAAKLKRPNGKSYYGASFASEMIAELADADFRKALDTIPYQRDTENSHRTVWQAIKEWFRKVFGVNTALDSLGDVLDNILDSYDGENISRYRRQREIMEQRTIDEGRTGDYMDYLEENAINGRASLVEDADLIERLESEPKITVYRAMQLQNGKLYPPMAAKVNGKWQDPLPLGEWSQADEHPELVNKDGKFDLDKGNGKKVAGVVYAPYMHGSTTMLNDQFKEAQDRPELVVVEAEMPESELTSGYQAEKSPRKTGMLDWKAGTIQGQLTGTRQVMLSRWVKPVRIVPSSEVAASIKQMIDGQVEVMPTNVVTPEQREELEKLGVKFVKTDNKEIIQEGEHKGEQYSNAYGKKSKRKTQRKTAGHSGKKAVDADPMEAISRAASAWRRSVVEDEGSTPVAHSAKAVYNERLNRVETVFTEAYQDSMIALKTAQNAIAHDKEIPDSQNAYMAENLMHGKNKNEQDLFNKLFRDPLIDTINKIMNVTGMNWGDVDRYVYTKSGLERNREFFVRDWLEAERKKTIRRYEDLNDAEQSIYDVFAARIEEDFEDGTIATEEEKDKKLTEALQKAHQEYVNQIEEEYKRIKNERYLDLQVGDSPALGMDSFTFSDYLDAIDAFIRRTIDGEYVASEHDYSGFRAMFGDEDGKYDEDAIIDELMNDEDMMEAENVDTLWKQINAATRYGLERYREAGMRSDEQIDQIEGMFHWYVPMRGFKEDIGEDMYQYFTQKGSAKSYVGGLLKHAKGRGSEANYPISTIFAMTYKAISDCNQNLVNQKFYRLCQANPNDLVVLSDSWAVLNERTGEWEEVAPEIGDDMNEEEIRETTLRFEEDMKQLASENKAKKIKGKVAFDYKPMDRKKQDEHIVDVRINGQPRKMIVTGNPRMAQALNGQLRFERGKNVFSKWNSAIKNFMASVFTSYSPTFALRNMFRDWTHFRMMLGVREGDGYAKQANKYYRQSLFKMIGLFKKYRNNTLNENDEMERDFKDFMDNGGITGFVFMQKIDDIQKEMEDIYKKQKAGKPIRLNNNLWEKILGAVEALNEGIENNARFATYRASRHYVGRTKARSAYDAKEITVNFNRKGAGAKTAGFKSRGRGSAYGTAVEDAAKAFGVTSQIFGEGRIFFNATVQAISTTFKNFQNADGSLNKKYIAKWAGKYALPPFMFGMLLPYINQMLAAVFDGGDGDDDPYANLPEWTRRKNICIYIGNNNFITIPIGQELAAFLTLGDIVAGNTYAAGLKPVDKGWDDEILGVLNTFSPVDIDTKITHGGLAEDPVDEVIGRTFSVLAPLVAVQQNLSWTGRPIYREDRFQNDQYTPEYQMVYSGTNPVLVEASKMLHEIGGGDDVTRGKLEVNPAIVQYLWEQYTGGPGKVFSNTISIGKDAKDILNGEDSDFNIRKVEGLKAFVQQGDDRTQYYRTQAKYYKYKADANALYDAVKGYEKSAAENPEYKLKLEELQKGRDYVRMQMIRKADRQLSKINKDANKADGAERKNLRRLYNRMMSELVKELDEVGE
jgi:hypothetical protein